MDNNIGKKFKLIAKFTTPLGVLSSAILSFIVSYCTNYTFFLVLITLGGSILSWFISLCLYGYGQLIENSDRQVELLEKLNQEAKKNNNKQEELPTAF